MNTKNIALDYLRKSKARLEALKTLLSQNSYDDVIRESQEIIELITKGTLRWIGIDPPKTHDVGHVLKKHTSQFPDFWQKEIAWIQELSKKLFEERGHSFYGDETNDIPASDLYEKKEAEQTIKDVEKLLTLYEKLLAL